MPTRTRPIRLAALLVLATATSARAQGVNTLPPALATKVEATVQEIMQKTQVPSVSIGIVQDGKIVYTAAFGHARLSPPLAATPDMHYAIGSISKQFTTACIMFLVQEGKLSLDDPVSRFFPELTRANEVTIRNLLTHTSGYEDYAPQDYTIPAWTHPTTAQAIIHEWATKPLDFDPGTQYQYSNTNFNILGLIVEKASGEPFWQFLSTRVLQPLHLDHTLNLDTEHDKVEVTGYARNALGPLRPARIEAPGWYFADGEMAMPVSDLLTWDISLMNRSLLSPSSYDAMETEMKLKNGQGIGYGLGVSVGYRNGHRAVTHSGEVGGFVAQNYVFPDDKVAIAVLTNQEASSAAGEVARGVTSLLFPLPPSATGDSATVARAEARAKQVLASLQKGVIDRSQFTDNANFYFDDTALADFKNSLGKLGAIKSLRQTGAGLRGGMTYRGYAVEFGDGTKVSVSTYTTNDGKLEQFLVDTAE